MSSLLLFICIFLGIFTISIAAVFQSIPYLLTGIVFFILAITLYSLKRIKLRLGYLILTSTIFVFLLSRTFSRFMLGQKLEEYFSDQNVYKALYYIAISLITLLIGEMIFTSSKKIRFGRYQFKQNTLKLMDDTITNKRYIHICKILFYIGAVCQLIVLICRIVLVATVGYVGSYLEISDVATSIPSVISKMADFYSISFIIMLALLPEYKLIKRCIYTYIAISALSLLTGARNGFFVPVVFLVWYVNYRSGCDENSKKTNRKKFKISYLIGIYIGIALIGIIGKLRIDASLDLSIFNPITVIADNLGGSNLVILNTFSIENKISKAEGLKFLFGPILNFLDNNIVSRFVFGTEIAPYNSVEYALNGKNFGSFLTYTCNQELYLAGGGFGSSYIAEAYVAGKTSGVIIISLLYSFVLSLPQKIRYNNWIVRTILFLMIYWLFYTPRDSALYFITSGLNITNLLVIFIVWLYGRKKSER